MTKQNFIALADLIRDANACHDREKLAGFAPFNANSIASLAGFCATQNAQFNRQRWLDYVAGKCGPNGGAI